MIKISDFIPIAGLVTTPVNDAVVNVESGKFYVTSNSNGTVFVLPNNIAVDFHFGVGGDYVNWEIQSDLGSVQSISVDAITNTSTGTANDVLARSAAAYDAIVLRGVNINQLNIVYSNLEDPTAHMNITNFPLRGYAVTGATLGWVDYSDESVGTETCDLGSFNYIASSGGPISGYGMGRAGTPVLAYDFETAAFRNIGSTHGGYANTCPCAEFSYVGCSAEVSPATTVLDKLIHDDETIVAAGSSLIHGQALGGGITGPDHAYFCGGQTTSGQSGGQAYVNFGSAVGKNRWSDDTSSTASCSMSRAAYYHRGSYDDTKGYTFGDRWFTFPNAENIPSGNSRAIIQSITFATDTQADMAATLSLARAGNACKAADFTYIVGGCVGYASYETMIDKFEHNSQSVSTLAASLSSGVAYSGFSAGEF